MMHLAAGGASLDTLANDRMRRALAARAARYDRNHNELTEWDGRVDASSESIAGIGRRERPVSPQRAGNLGRLPVPLLPRARTRPLRPAGG